MVYIPLSNFKKPECVSFILSFFLSFILSFLSNFPQRCLRPFELEIFVGYFWKPQNDCFSLLISKAFRGMVFITNSVQSWTIFRQKQSNFVRNFWAKYYKQDDANNIPVQQSFSGFQKGLTQYPSTNGSKDINFLVRVARLES